MKQLLGLLSLISLTSFTPPVYTLRQVYDAIKVVETGNKSGIDIKGDNGKAYGPYQIHKAYFIDSGVKGNWDWCLKDKEFSERVMLGYWKRYCPQALSPINPEVLAKVHNLGGPMWKKKQDLGDKYWNKVKEHLIK